MNYLIQRGKVRQQAISVPEGLPELLSDITREVLRCQPTKECLCQFIIDYLHSVIVTREKALVAKTILDQSLRQVDSIISDLCICDLSREKSELMGEVLEECFTKFLEKRRCDMRRGKEMMNFEDVDMLEELLEKCKFSAEELNMSRPAIDTAYKRFVDAYMSAQRGTDGTELLYQYFRDRELKRIEKARREQAAITIQAAWRGYWVRSQFPKAVCVCTCATEKEDDEEDKRRNAAAFVIQRFFRHVMMRAGAKPIIDPCADSSHSMDKGDSLSPIAEGEATALTTAAATAVPTAAPTAQPSATGLDAKAPAQPEEEPPAAVTPAEAPHAEAPPPEAPPAEAPPAEAPPSEAPPAEAPPAEAPPAEAPPAEVAEEAAPEETPPPAEEAPPAAAEEAAPAAAEEPAPPPAEEAPPAEAAPPPEEEAPAEAAAE